ncbi:polysaccharide deacetylase family protein [Paenibacillus kribbensis]|uniref:polysaccharide deacetylase family protein n=1 Tax=Paenibacillus kribbensis TaxID=172713 RepID=UPI0015BAFA91|nr:polysaccharide deacetylase family protein [Paenibacillus kribbensis]
MGNIAAMYHYVREKKGWDGIVPMHPHDFEVQLDLISKTHKIISLDEIDKYNSQPWCILTFDDGTKDQYTVAYDILKRKGIPAYFTIMSGLHITGNVPLVHLVHTVLSFKSDEELWELLSGTYDTSGVEEESQIYKYEQKKLRRYNKFMLNFKLSVTEATVFLESIFQSLFPDKQKFINDFYISTEEIVEMSRAGMTIGVHAHNHIPYNGDPQEFYDIEIGPCKDWMKSVLGINPIWYTPAFGGGVNQKLMLDKLTPVLVQNGFVGAFSTREGEISDNREFWMDRIDCIRLPPLGTSSYL